MKKIEGLQIHAYDCDTLKVVAIDPKLAGKLNRTFKTYPKGTSFVAQEPLFSISQAELGLLDAILPKSIVGPGFEKECNLELTRYNTED